MGGKGCMYTDITSIINITILIYYFLGKSFLGDAKNIGNNPTFTYVHK